MKVIAEYEDGTRKELGEIEELKGVQENARALVVQTDCLLKQEDRVSDKVLQYQAKQLDCMAGIYDRRRGRRGKDLRRF